MITLNGMIYTGDCVFSPGRVIIEDDRIKEVQLCDKKDLKAQEQEQYLIPGLVDVELICDGVHIHPSVVRNTFRIFGDDRVVLISDSMRATGMEDGNYTLGGQTVIVKGSVATLEDGTIAGSVTDLYACMKKAISMGVSKELAIKAATINPARSIGIDDVVGSIEAGRQADIVFADKDLNRKRVMIGGRIYI